MIDDDTAALCGIYAGMLIVERSVTRPDIQASILDASEVLYATAPEAVWEHLDTIKRVIEVTEGTPRLWEVLLRASIIPAAPPGPIKMEEE